MNKDIEKMEKEFDKELQDMGIYHNLNGQDRYQIIEFIQEQIILAHNNALTLAEEAVGKECKECHGTGKVICSNPDHGGLDSGLYGAENSRLGCPVCGHDPYYRTKDNCEICKVAQSTINSLRK